MIYSIHPDVEHYLSFAINADEAESALGEETEFHFDERPLSWAAQWQPMELDFYSAIGKKVSELPDISQTNGRLFLSDKAFQALKSVLEPFGEFLPITYQGNQGFLFTIFETADAALDKQLCTKNEWGDITWIAFDTEKLSQAPIFRTEYDDYQSVFCQDEFRQVYEEAELTGLIFTEDLSPTPP